MAYMIIQMFDKICRGGSIRVSRNDEM